MEEMMHDAGNELKRVDHLIHVSLKYTRTVDVLLSVLKRFISFIDITLDILLKKAEEDKKILEIPEMPAPKVNAIKRAYQEDIIINQVMDDYLLFRRLVRAPNTKRNEFRRYVTMTVDDNGTIVEIDIDKVVEYFDNLKQYFSHIRKNIFETENN